MEQTDVIGLYQGFWCLCELSNVTVDKRNLMSVEGGSGFRKC